MRYLPTVTSAGGDARSQSKRLRVAQHTSTWVHWCSSASTNWDLVLSHWLGLSLGNPRASRWAAATGAARAAIGRYGFVEVDQSGWYSGTRCDHMTGALDKLSHPSRVDVGVLEKLLAGGAPQWVHLETNENKIHACLANSRRQAALKRLLTGCLVHKALGAGLNEGIIRVDALVNWLVCMWFADLANEWPATSGMLSLHNFTLSSRCNLDHDCRCNHRDLSTVGLPGRKLTE